MSAALPQYPNDLPLPWETAEQFEASQRCYDLVDRATANDRDTLSALAWLSRTVAESDTKADAMGYLQGKLAEEEWPTWLTWREGVARYLAPVMEAKHARRVSARVAA